MKRTLLLAAAAFGLGSAALAQSSSTVIDPTPTNISFRGGIVFALDDGLRDIDKSWAGFGLDYRFDKQYIANSETFVSLDVIFRSNKFSRGSFWPLMICQRFYTGDGSVASEGSRNYLQVGVGPVFFDVVNSDTGLGFKGGIGKEFGPNIFGEINLFLSEKVDGGVNANSVGIYLGYRF